MAGQQRLRPVMAKLCLGDIAVSQASANRRYLRQVSTVPLTVPARREVEVS